MPKKPPASAEASQQLVHIAGGPVTMEGMLRIPPSPQGVVLFAHGSGSSRHSPRNNYVADVLCQGGLATLLIDLLSPSEDATFATRFDIDLLTQRLSDIVRWLQRHPHTQTLPIGLFGSSTGAAAALAVAAALGDAIGAVVSRGGRPDLAGEALPLVSAPTLLIVGANDSGVIELNEQAYALLPCPKELTLVPHATHLFEEPGCLEQVALLARRWFTKHLQGRRPR